MKTKIYAIYDSKAEAYMQPFFAGTNGLAIRIFADHAQNPEAIINKHPGDFTLFNIGDFDDQSADITPTKTPISLGVAVEFISQELEAI